MHRLIAAVLLAGVLAAPSMALPSIRLIQTGAATGRLEVIVTDSGSIAAEIALTSSGGWSLTNVAVNSAIFDTANPGDSPFIPGSPEGGDSVGLTFEPELKRAFASFGSGVVVGPGTYPFLTFGFRATGPVPGGSVITASGLVAQGGVKTIGLQDIESPVVGDVFSDFDGNGYSGDGDLTLVLANWGRAVPPVPAGWTGSQPTAPIVGDDELTKLLGEWGGGAPRGTSSIPEPAAATIVAVGVATTAFRGARRRGN